MTLSSNERISYMENRMTPKQFNKFMKMENKKFDYNQKFELFEKKQKKSNEIIEKNKKIIVEKDDQLFEIYNNSSLTFTGNFAEILEKVSDYKRNADLLKQESYRLERETQCMIDDSYCKEKRINFESAIITIDTDLYENGLEQKKRIKQEASDPKWQQFLKRLNLMPDDVLNVIQSYFTYETRAAILEKIYQPLKIFYSLKKEKLIRIVYHIYRKFCIRTKNCVLREKTIQLWDNLFGVHNLNENTWVSMSTLKKLLAYWFVLFRKHNRHRYCFSIYAASTFVQNC